MKRFRSRPSIRYTFLMFSSYLGMSLIDAITRGSLSCASLRIGEFADINRYYYTSNLRDVVTTPFQSLVYAPRERRHQLALLIVSTGTKVIPSMRDAHKYNPETLSLFVKIGAKIRIHEILGCLLTRYEGQLRVLFTLSGEFPYKLDLRYTPKYTGMWYSFREKGKRLSRISNECF